MLDRAQLAAIIDHTLLRPEATRAQVAAFVEEAEALGVYAVCVSPSVLPLRLRGPVVATVCGFPSGAVQPSVKAAEAALALEQGAGEVDMVIDLGAVKGGDWGRAAAHIRAVRAASAGAVLKVIIESAALTDHEITTICAVAEGEGADFVKTSTGFHPSGGASVHAVRLMSEAVGGRLGVKASGGIRTVEFAQELVRAGATRLGLSASAAILAAATTPIDPTENGTTL